MSEHKPNHDQGRDPGPELPAPPSEAEAREAVNELLRTWLRLPPAVQGAILALLRQGRPEGREQRTKRKGRK
jgi:hypothetical protein